MYVEHITLCGGNARVKAFITFCLIVIRYWCWNQLMEILNYRRRMIPLCKVLFGYYFFISIFFHCFAYQPSSIGSLPALEELWIDCNYLVELPAVSVQIILLAMGLIVYVFSFFVFKRFSCTLPLVCFYL